MDVTRTLEEIGLSKGETKIYLTLLRIGSSLVSRLAKETGLHRTNIYDTLEKLKEKGLVSYVIKENRKYFSAAKPDKLLDYLEEQKVNIEKILPKLKNLKKLSKEETLVEIYKGKEGLKTVLKDVLKEGKDYFVLEEEGYIHNVLPYFYSHFNKKMEKAKIKVNILTKAPGKIAKRKNMKIKSLPDFLAVPSATAIYGNKVAIFVWDLPYYAILIKSKQVADSYRNFFNLLWKKF